MDIRKGFHLVPHMTSFEASSFRDHGETAQLDPKFSCNENTTGSPRGCFMIIYNGNIR